MTDFMKPLKAVLATVLFIALVFIAASIFDIILSVVSSRFYSKAAFITIFGVAGIFGGLMAYSAGMQVAGESGNIYRLPIVLLVLATGIIFFLWLARIEGGEYKPAFQAYGVTTALSGLGCLWWSPSK